MKYLSVFDSDENVLKAFADIYLKDKWYDLDCTFSKGVFWKNLQRPKYISDIMPLYDDVIQADCKNLSYLENGSISSIVFDPPFLFRNRKSDNNDRISARFSYFKTYDDLITMYEQALNEFWKKLNRKGFVFFKCQDMTDGKFYCTHNDIINFAISNGYILKDIAIKASKQKLQKDARQQNCVAKVHSYWLVFQKKVTGYER